MSEDLAAYRGHERFNGWDHGEDLTNSIPKDEFEQCFEFWVNDAHRFDWDGKTVKGWGFRSSERWRTKQHHIIRRTEVQKTAQAFLEYPFVVFDTETTGLDSSYDEIVQIGVVNHRGEVLLDTLIKPRRAIPKEATRIHGITNEDVANAPSFREVYDELYRVLDNQRWAVYNLSFDREFIEYECERRGLWKPSPASTSRDYDWEAYQLDVMNLYAEWWGDKHDYYDSYTWQKLSVANERHHLYDGQAHNALADALTTLNLLKMMGANRND